MSRQPTIQLLFPSMMMKFTMSTVANTVAVSNIWKLKESGWLMHHPMMTQKGATKRAIWVEEPMATLRRGVGEGGHPCT